MLCTGLWITVGHWTMSEQNLILSGQISCFAGHIIWAKKYWCPIWKMRNCPVSTFSCAESQITANQKACSRCQDAQTFLSPSPPLPLPHCTRQVSLRDANNLSHLCNIWLSWIYFSAEDICWNMVRISLSSRSFSTLARYWARVLWFVINLYFNLQILKSEDWVSHTALWSRLFS